MSDCNELTPERLHLVKRIVDSEDHSLDIPRAEKTVLRVVQKDKVIK